MIIIHTSPHTCIYSPKSFYIDLLGIYVYTPDVKLPYEHMTCTTHEHGKTFLVL